MLTKATRVRGDPCPPGFPEQCRCGPANLTFLDRTEEFASAVVCTDLRYLVSDEFLEHVPFGTEGLVLKGGDLDALPEGRLLLADAATRIGSQLRLLALEDLSDGGSRLDLGSLLCAFPRLQELRLRNASVPSSRLRVVSQTCARRLHRLDLRSNSARSLPEPTVRWLNRRPELGVLLAGNPFSCDCNLHALHEWLLVHRGDGAANYTCTDGYPETLKNRRLLDVQPEELKCSDEAPEAAAAEDRAAMRGLYLAAATLGAVAAAVALFALYLHFPVFELFGYGCRKPDSPLLPMNKPTGLGRKQYTSLPSLLNETAA